MSPPFFSPPPPQTGHNTIFPFHLDGADPLDLKCMNFPTHTSLALTLYDATASHSLEQLAVCQRKQSEHCESSEWETVQPECVFV